MNDGVATAVRIWAAAELRRRWKGLVLLGVLAGLAAGLGIAAIDGARRSSTAYQRMRRELGAADAIFFPSQVRFDDADVTKLATIPEVAAWGGFSLTAGQLDGLPPGANPLVAVGSDWFDTLERPKVLAGRLPDPASDDEAVITEPLLAQGGSLGAELTWRTLSPEQVQDSDPSSSPDFDWATSAKGPTTVLKVVGVIRMPMESVVSFASDGLLLTGPGWAAKHLDQVAHFTNAVVRLRGGGADVPAFTEAVARVYGRSDVPIKDLRDDIKRIQSSVDLERTALLLFGAAVLAAAAVIVGQAFVRSVRAGAEAVPTLEAMGLPRRGLVLGLTVPHVLTAVVAVPVALLTAILLSSRFPIGLARRLDPELGIHVDTRLLAVGLAALVAAMFLVVVVTSELLVRRLGRSRRGRLRVVGAASRAGAPLPVAIGASLALEPASGRSPGTVRPALVAAAAGVVAIVAAITLVGGIDDALHRPARVGTVWDLDLEAPDTMDVATARQLLADDPDVEAAAVLRRSATFVDGVDAPLYSVDPITGSIRFVILDGRSPEAPDEIALGPRTAKLTRAKVGDLVTAGPDDARLQVVGIALLPQTPHSSFDEGALLTGPGFDGVVHTGPDETATTGMVRLHKGADTEAAVNRLFGLGFFAAPPAAVPDVANLANVRSLPLYLAAFLGVLALGAVAHVLLTGARRRAHDLAVLRALGLTPRQTAACVAWQATIIGLVALAIGIPLGLVVGRQVWQALTSALSFVYVGPLDVPVLLVLIPASLLLVVLLALVPARAAARLDTSEVLRAE